MRKPDGAKPEEWGSRNTIVTRDQAQAAVERIKAKLKRPRWRVWCSRLWRKVPNWHGALNPDDVDGRIVTLVMIPLLAAGPLIVIYWVLTWLIQLLQSGG